jgi:lipopolysaccharide export system protein LptA
MGNLLAAVRKILWITAITLLPIATACAAAENPSEPINIEANRMVSQENDNSVVFIGNVDARQGKLTIRTDEMTVFYTGAKNTKDKQATSQMEKLICKNNVKIVQNDWLGTGDRMDYFAKERKVILSGNAKAWQGQNMVAGKTIIYYLDEKRSVVEQDETTKSRVRAVLHPESNKKP